jgi:hypothetical protein
MWRDSKLLLVMCFTFLDRYLAKNEEKCTWNFVIDLLAIFFLNWVVTRGQSAKTIIKELLQISDVNLYEMKDWQKSSHGHKWSIKKAGLSKKLLSGTILVCCGKPRGHEILIRAEGEEKQTVRILTRWIRMKQTR